MGFDPMGAVSTLFGGGGGGGGGAAGFAEFLAWIRERHAEIEQRSEREEERAGEVTRLRRGDLLDRPGFSGLVTVGDAVQRSDETLAAQMRSRPADDPQRQAYEDALASERSERTRSRRVISGEQYRAEDALSDLRDRLEELRTATLNPNPEELGSLRSDVEELTGQYEWLDVDPLLSDIEAEMGRKRFKLSSREPRWGD